MRTREVPKSSWAKTLENIANSKTYQLVHVQVDGEDLGDQQMAHDLPLLGISVESKGSAADAIELTLSREGGVDNLTHVIAHPVHLYLQEDDQGEVAGIDIEDSSRVKTLIFFTGETSRHLGR